MLIICAFSEDGKRDVDLRIENLIFQISEGKLSAVEDLYDLIGTDIYAYALSKTANKAKNI